MWTPLKAIEQLSEAFAGHKLVKVTTTPYTDEGVGLHFEDGRVLWLGWMAGKGYMGADGLPTNHPDIARSIQLVKPQEDT